MIKLKLYTPKGEVRSRDDVVSITLPTVSGVITVLEDHQPILSLLGIGEIEVVYGNGDKDYIFTTSGILRVTKDSNVVILADTSEFSHEIDVEEALKAKVKAEEYLKNNSDRIGDNEFIKLQSDIEKEVAKIDIGRLRARKGSDIKVKVERKDV